MGSRSQLEGDTSFVKDSCWGTCPVLLHIVSDRFTSKASHPQDLLDYLALFTENQKTTVATPTHPLDLVMSAFKDAETSGASMVKMRTFLRDASAAHGRQVEMATKPVA